MLITVTCCPQSSKRQSVIKMRKTRKLKTGETTATTKCSNKKTIEKQKYNVGFFYGPRSVVSGERKILIGQTPKSIKR